MLNHLFGNKSIECILFFILINGRGYGGKIARQCQLALTPIQQGLIKLESIGILESYVEGKIRYFQFNRDCAYLLELEGLLRKAYTLLSASQKKEYYDPELNKKRLHKCDKKLEMTEFKNHLGIPSLAIRIWEKLSTIKNMSFTAISQSKANSGWNGIGKGTVETKKQNDHAVIFVENGSWISKEGKEFTFTNTFRWTLDRFQNLITLEHLRFGEHNPVFLFHLAQSSQDVLESISSHICNDDTYLGQVRCHNQLIKLNWRIIGPKKNEEIDYVYT